MSLGGLVHRLDPGIIPFRKALECQIHIGGGEFSLAANLSDCFGLRTGIATAMVRYPIGTSVAESVRATGVKPDLPVDFRVPVETGSARVYPGGVVFGDIHGVSAAYTQKR